MTQTKKRSLVFFLVPEFTMVAFATAIEPLRIAVPDTPGGRILFAYVSADFAAIGVPSRRVAMASAADSR